MTFPPWWLALLRTNPVLARELRQELRAGRALLLLFGVTVALAVLMLGITGLFKANRTLVDIGPVAFQVFFSLAYFAVSLLSPTLAAFAFSSERDGRTWEALITTPLELRAIARGKFWASAITVAALLAMITPLSLLCLVLGGVSLMEIAVALFLLGLVAANGVAFGAAVGAWARGTGTAGLASLGTALLAAPLLYFGAGIGMSFLAHGTWPGVPQGIPVWLPYAYTRAQFDGSYLLLLVVLPPVITTFSLWFFYEVTVAGLSDESDDRITGLKHWYLTALPFVAALSAIPGYMTRGTPQLLAWLAGLGGLLLFLGFAALILVGDAWEASTRVEHRWEQRKAAWLTRMLGPGLVQTSMLLLVSGLLATALFSLIGAAVVSYRAARGLPPPPAVALLLCSESWAAFFVFLVGFLLWARARSGSASAARVLSLVVAGFVLAAPWIVFVAAHYGGDKHGFDILLLASPSPLYALAVVRAILRGQPHLAVVSAIACSLGWVLMGVTLFGLGARRATRIVAVRRHARRALATQLSAELSERAALRG
jgi:ABC-type transport system involved in cytochrome c biogenesis permease component